MQSESNTDNIRIVQSVYAAFSNRNFDLILDALAEDIEWGEPFNPFNPSGGTKYGHEGFKEWLRIGRDSEEVLVLEPKKFLVDNDSVAVVGFTKCLAKATNKTYETDFVHLFTFKENKIARFQEFFDTYIAGEAFKI